MIIIGKGTFEDTYVVLFMKKKAITLEAIGKISYFPFFLIEVKIPLFHSVYTKFILKCECFVLLKCG